MQTMQLLRDPLMCLSLSKQKVNIQLLLYLPWLCHAQFLLLCQPKVWYTQYNSFQEEWQDSCLINKVLCSVNFTLAILFIIIFAAHMPFQCIFVTILGTISGKLQSLLPCTQQQLWKNALLNWLMSTSTCYARLLNHYLHSCSI